MRIYLPTTMRALAAVLRAGEIASPVCAFTVTPALREWYASGDLEELEYAAMAAAARASLRLLAADPGAPRRRVVLAAEVPPEAAIRGASPDRAAVLVQNSIPLANVVSAHVDDAEAAVRGASPDRAAVLVQNSIPLANVVSAHVDDAEAALDVEAAVAALPAADGGDEDARFTVDGAEGHELLWYAASELSYLAG